MEGDGALVPIFRREQRGDATRRTSRPAAVAQRAEVSSALRATARASDAAAFEPDFDPNRTPPGTFARDAGRGYGSAAAAFLSSRNSGRARSGLSDAQRGIRRR